MTFQKGHKINVGRKHSEEYRTNIKNKMTGRKLSDKTKKRISDKHKGKSVWNSGLNGENYSKHYKNGHPRGMIGKENKWGHHSERSKIKISAYQQGIDIEDWNGYKQSLNRYLKGTAMYQIWRNAVFLKDNFTCKNPNCEFCKNKMGVYLHAHHKKPIKFFPELAFNIDNGITYCMEFHLKTGMHKNMQGGLICLGL